MKTINEITKCCMQLIGLAFLISIMLISITFIQHYKEVGTLNDKIEQLEDQIDNSCKQIYKMEYDMIYHNIQLESLGYKITIKDSE